MTTVASIINDALRETNLIPLGVTPTTDQTAEAFRLLSTIVAGVLGNEAGENLNPFPLGQNEIEAPRGYPWWSNELPGNVFLPTNLRVMCNLTGPGMINLHPRPHDGARMGIVDVSQNFDINPLTIVGNGRSIEGDSEMTYNTPGEVRQWVYREDIGNWVTVIPLVSSGEMPWPPEFDDMFIILLAIRLNPRYGQVINPASTEVLKSAMSKFSARYSQSTTQVGVEAGLLYLTHWDRYWGYGAGQQSYGDPTAFFNSGIPF
jgi:hypothetical protein